MRADMMSAMNSRPSMVGTQRRLDRIAFGAMLTLGFMATAAAGQGGSLPLDEVMQLAKPYPNLQMQVRLTLVGANLKQSQVVCSGARFSNAWAGLGGARHSPYECKIGSKTLIVTATPTYYDTNGHKLKPGDKALEKKAARLEETRLKWRWK